MSRSKYEIHTLTLQPIKLLYIKGAKSSEKNGVFYIMKGTIFGDMLDDDGTGNDDDKDCDGEYEDDEDIEDENVDGPVPYFSSSINDKVILSNFHDWLKGPDGGRKDNKCSKQCTRQVQMVMQQINPKKQAITDLLSKMTLRDKWLVPVEKKKQPGTVKSLDLLPSFSFFYMQNVARNLKSSTQLHHNLFNFLIK